MPRPVFPVLLSAAAAILCSAATVRAQGYARMFLNAPENTDMAMFTYQNTRSNTEADLDISNPGSEARINVGSFAYARIMNIGGRTGGPGFSIPYITAHSSDSDSGQTLADLEGWGDPAFTFDINLFGADAMPREEFVLTPSRTYCSLHMALGTPWGSYDSSQSFNPGGNRWTGKATLNYSITCDEGVSWFDVYAAAKFFGDNDDFFGGRNRSQEPLFSLETHYSHNVNPRIWLGGGLAYSNGGQLALDGFETGSAQNSVKGIVSAGFRLWKGSTGIISYNHTLIRPDDAPKEGTLMLQFILTF
jgi:hypothetical protein